ncbi:hypothetical protein [Hansschlegelia sp. KR7-227]|uniref:hypothetical protein n=1 Tax=Hansschlegelia sp. KR7-227 TaxID=3400914 RepID=UPI003C0831C5
MTMAIDVKLVFRELSSDEMLAVGEVLDRLSSQLSEFSGSEDFEVAFKLARRFIIETGINISTEPLDNEPWSVDFTHLRTQYADLISKHNLAALEREAADEIRSWKESRDGLEFGIARFSEDERAKIIVHIERLRIVISDSDLGEKKKARMLGLVASLYEESLQAKTRTERYFAFMGDMAFAVGDMAEKAKPAVEQVKEILKIVMRSQAREEGVVLPPSDNLPQIPSS